MTVNRTEQKAPGNFRVSIVSWPTSDCIVLNLRSIYFHRGNRPLIRHPPIPCGFPLTTDGGMGQDGRPQVFVWLQVTLFQPYTRL